MREREGQSRGFILPTTLPASKSAVGRQLGSPEEPPAILAIFAFLGSFASKNPAIPAFPPRKERNTLRRRRLSQVLIQHGQRETTP